MILNKGIVDLTLILSHVGILRGISLSSIRLAIRLARRLAVRLVIGLAIRLAGRLAVRLARGGIVKSSRGSGGICNLHGMDRGSSNLSHRDVGHNSA
jgi:hypothetical protein